MATNTRVAMTIASKYVKRKGAVEAFYLDGRMNGKREEQYADLTVDRTDRGAFYALYASSHGSTHPADGQDGNKQILDRIGEALKNNHRQNIDYQINELAEGAVNVVGRLTLSEGEEQKPYFAGMIVKDGELAAVTLGSGCAYLYRDDAVFPLTEDDYPLEPIDTLNRQISNFHDFSAGVAGSIRYSNIAQLRPDDCIILCNCALMEAIGQKVMLQLLDEAEDQADAVGLIMSEATHRNPDMNYQIMIGFIEEVEPLDRVGRNTLAKGLNIRDTLGRMPAQKTGPVALSKGPRNTGTLTPEERAKIAAAVAQGPITNIPDPNKPSQLGRDDWKKDLASAEVTEAVAAEAAGAEASAEVAGVEAAGAEAPAEVGGVEAAAEVAAEVAAPAAQQAGDGGAQTVDAELHGVESVAAKSGQTEPVGASARPEEQVAAQQESQAETRADGDLFDEIKVEDASAADSAGPSIDLATAAAPAPSAATEEGDLDDWGEDDLSYNFVDDYEGQPPTEAEDEEEYKDPLLYTGDKKSADKGKRIAIVVLIVIALILISFIISILVKGSKEELPADSILKTSPTFPSSTLPSQSSASVVPSISETTTTPPTTEAPTTTTTTAAETTTTTAETTTAPPETEAPTTTEATGSYTVKDGDNLWDIVSKHYPGADPISKMNEIAKANGFAGYEDVVLTPGNNLVLP